jgi:hypothetical protein
MPMADVVSRCLWYPFGKPITLTETDKLHAE